MAHPRMYDDSNPAIERLREICLALPEVFEKEAWGECTFRVTGGSMFAMTDNNHHSSGHVAVWIKAPAMVQEILVGSDQKRFFVPPYMGKQGWVGVRIDYKVKWDQLRNLNRPTASVLTGVGLTHSVRLEIDCFVDCIRCPTWLIPFHHR